MASPGGIDTSEALRDGLIPRDELPVIKHLERNIKANEDFCSARWKNAEENQRFVMGGEHQWGAADYKERMDSKRPTFSMNDIALAVHALAGREMTARFEGSYLARSREDQGLNNALREAAKKVRDTALAQHIESDKFRDLIIDDYAWTEWLHVFEGQPRGQTIVRGRNLWEMMWDSAAEMPNLLDRSWDAWGGWIPVDDYLMMFPGEREKLQEFLVQDRLGWLEPDHEKTTRWPWLHRSAGHYYKDKQREIFACDYEWREREACYYVDVPVALQWTTADGKERSHPTTEEGLAKWQEAAALAQQGLGEAPGPPPAPTGMVLGEDEIDGFLESYAQHAFAQGLPTAEPPDMLGPQDGWYRWSYQRAFIVGRRVVKQWKLPGQRFCRQCMVAFPMKQPDGTIRFGPVDLMKDPQKYKNATYSMTTSLIQRSQKGGMYWWEGLFDDPQDAERRMAHPYPMIKLTRGVDPAVLSALSIPISPFPHGVDRILAMADEAIWRPMGMTPATAGALTDPRRVTTGVLEQISDQVMVVQSPLFDSLRLMRKEVQLLLLDLFREHYTADDLREIVGPEKAVFIPEKKEWETAFARDVVVEEVAVSKSEKERAWDYGSRQGTWEKMLQMQQMPPWIFVKMIPEGWLNEEDRSAWIAWLQQREAAMQQAGAVQPPA